MRLEFPAANVLRNHAVQEKRIEQIDVIHHEEARPLGIEIGSEDAADFCAGEKNNPPGEGALQPVVLFRIEKYRQENERRSGYKEVQIRQRPQKEAAHFQPRALHTYTSRADGRISSALHVNETISPSTITSTGIGILKSTWRTERRDASGCWMCVPS